MEPQAPSYQASPRRPATYRDGNKQEEGAVAFGKEEGRDFLSLDLEMKTVMVKQEQDETGGGQPRSGAGEKCTKLSP